MANVRLAERPVLYTYKDHSQQIKTVMRRPPPIQHEMLPLDEVTLNVPKNQDWSEGDYVVKHINPRHPNIIQIENSEGQATFVHAFELELDEMVAPRFGDAAIDQPKNNAYLLWP